MNVPRPDLPRFLAEIRPAAEAVCPQYGIDPAMCIQAASDCSDGGRHVMHYNWWELPGMGDAGMYQSVVPVRTDKSAGGGWGGSVQQFAQFSSPAAAVDAWCRAIRQAVG